jgi:hypothetical protein
MKDTKSNALIIAGIVIIAVVAAHSGGLFATTNYTPPQSISSNVPPPPPQVSGGILDANARASYHYSNWFKNLFATTSPLTGAYGISTAESIDVFEGVSGVWYVQWNELGTSFDEGSVEAIVIGEPHCKHIDVVFYKDGSHFYTYEPYTPCNTVSGSWYLVFRWARMNAGIYDVMAFEDDILVSQHSFTVVGEPAPTPTPSPTPTPTPPPSTECIGSQKTCVYDFTYGLYRVDKCVSGSYQFDKWCEYGGSCTDGVCSVAPTPTPTMPSPTPTPPTPTPTVPTPPAPADDDWWQTYAIFGGIVAILLLLYFAFRKGR